MMIRQILCLAVALSVVQCTHAPAPEVPTKEGYQVPSLSKFEATNRAEAVRQVDYSLEFDLTDPGEAYKGRVTISFQSLAAERDLRIDFAEGKIERVAVNEKPVDVTYNGRFLIVPGRWIQKGTQRIEIDFTQNYSRQGRGVARFQDPVDKLSYVYTDFEPYDANRAFPCFDQPDLKATYTLKVVAPKSWEVITSVRESGTESRDDGSKVWTFPQSARFSTYIFSLHAGPYTKWEDKDFRIPLRLFARKSVAKYVHVKDWFPITRHGFDFYESFFGTPYPYKKYDQIIVPEFNAGAMENVAAVTFTEYLVGRGEMTKAQQRALSITILHEMAHMWFGDYVTMKWWGDLWLNESFATFMSSVALAAHRDYPEAWTQFFAGKFGAYWSDQMSTTHPIVANVKDTNDAFTTFDAITYGKGASVLKQLMYLMGEDKFKKGLKVYFERYAEKNAEYKDFLAVMSEVADRDLGEWKKLWLESAGLNTLSVQFECRNNRISQFVIAQTAPSGDQVPRPHALKIALMGRANGEVTVNDILNVEVAAATNYIPEAIGKACPHVVYPNYGDYAYAKVKLDPISVNTLKYSINEVKDELLRYQLWYSLWDKVRDGELSYLAFGDMILPESIAHEQNDFIMRYLAGNAANILAYFELTQEVSAQEKNEFANHLDEQVWSRLKRAKRGSAEQMVWLDLLPQVTSSPGGIKRIKQLLRGQDAIAGVTLDQDRRWNLVTTVARHGDAEARSIIDSEAKRDPSSQGKERQIGALASLPAWEEKTKWIEEFKNQKSAYSFSQLRSALRNLFPYNQNVLRAKYSDQFFADMKTIDSTRENFVAGMFTVLAPNECDRTTAGKTEAFLKSTPNLKVVIRKALQNNIEEGGRCQKIVAAAKDGTRFAPK